MNVTFRNSIFILFLVFLFGTIPSIAAEEIVRLRVINGPVGTWEKSLKGIVLRDAVAKVKNVSPATAKKVKVILKISGGKEVQMSGPTTLEKFEEAEYSVKSSTPAHGTAKLWVKFECENCRR